MNCNDVPITRQQMNRIYGCIRTLSEQIYGILTQQNIERMKTYVMFRACEEGYPFSFNSKIFKPKSLSLATMQEAHLVNMAINHIADQFYPEKNRALYLYEVDNLGPYKSIGGRTREEMMKDYPELIDN
jgi:hypothetical protein